MAKALQGIRVLDLSQVLAGPSCCQQLALLGADVVKIESPDGGDQMRRRLLPSRLGAVDMAAGFLTMNMAKRSLALNIKDARGRDALTTILRGADAIIHNFRGGVVDRLGLDYAAVKAVNPAIVYTAITGFGSCGPRAEDAAYDGAVQAASAMMSNNGTDASGPLRTGYFAVDMMTGMSAAFATTAALLRREREGVGQMVDVAMLDCAIAMQAAGFARSMIDATPDSLLGNQSATGVPTADSFPTAQGALLIAATMANHIRALFEGLGIAAMLDDPRFTGRDAMVENRAEVRARMIEALSGDTAENWEQRLAALGVPVARINGMVETMAMPQLSHRAILTEPPRAKGVDEDLTLVAAPYMTSEDGPEADRPPPGLGEHSREVLAEYGVEEGEIEALIEAGVVRQG